MTVAELRAHLADLDDDAEVLVAIPHGETQRVLVDVRAGSDLRNRAPFTGRVYLVAGGHPDGPLEPWAPEEVWFDRA